MHRSLRSDKGPEFLYCEPLLGAVDHPVAVRAQERHVYRRLRLPDSEIRILIQKTSDEKTSKERMHLDLETDDVEAEVKA